MQPPRLVLVTGAASGLGRELAIRFARRGDSLVLWDRDRQGLESLSREPTLAPVKATIVEVDLTDAHSIDTAARRTRQEAGHPDLLVQCAGIVNGKALLELTDEEIRRTFDVNTLALFRVTRAFLPAMIERGSGHVVTLASASGIAGIAGLTDYAASKHAAVGFDESLRMEMRKAGHAIDTTVVCPYFIDTGMFDGAQSRFPWLLPILDPAKVVDRIVRAIDRREHRVHIPRFVAITYLARYLPTSWFDRISTMLGLDEAMDGFRGRQ